MEKGSEAGLEIPKGERLRPTIETEMKTTRKPWRELEKTVTD